MANCIDCNTRKRVEGALRCKRCAAERLRSMKGFFMSQDTKVAGFPTRYFKFRGKVYAIFKRGDGLWRDAWGCVYALAEDENSVDRVNRFGVGLVSLPEDHPASIAATPHDYKYSSLAYQLYHSRDEADAELLRDVKLYSRNNFLARLGHLVSRLLGRFFWEVEETR